MDPVLLLRAPAEEGPDPYETVFRTRGYAPISVPVLETLIVNLNDLKKKVAVGPKGQGLSGVIITSKRAIEAWSKAVEELSAPDSHSGPHSPGWPQ